MSLLRVARISGCIGVLALFAACSSSNSSSGGGGGASQCGKVSPCGGNIVGDWKITDACESTASITPPTECPGETLQSVSLTASGSAQFGGDSKYTTSTTLAATIVINIPSSCLSSGGVTITCDELNAQMQQGDAGATNVASAKCVTAGAACDCTLVSTPATSNTSGTYTTSGTTLSTTPSGGTASDDGYCVQGSSTLHVMSLSTTMGMGSMGQASVTSDLVGTKQ